MIQRLERKMTRQMLLTAIAAGTLSLATGAQAQEQPATIHGHVQNAAGQAITNGQVKLTTEIHKSYADEKFSNTADIDKEGNYTVSGVAPGEYFGYVVVNGKAADQLHFTLKAGDNTQEDFDMTRPEYLAKMTPEERKSLEEFKTKNAAAVAGNKQIANLNAMITAVRTDIKSPTPNFDKDISDMKTATEQRPTEGLLYAVQGEVYAAQARKLAAADRANKTIPAQDDAWKTASDGAVTSLQKAADLMAAAKPPSPEQQATVYNQLGNAYADAGKTTEASAAYDKAVALMPAKAGQYYYNEAATMFNARQDDGALVAADKAIAADPNQAMPYYIKGQELLAKATLDSKGQVVPPPGCLDAYNKYLQLAPDGPYAPAVKDVLTQMGQKIETKYKAPGRK